MKSLQPTQRVCQEEIRAAHAERVLVDEAVRSSYRQLREAWEAAGGPQAEEQHFNWLRRMPEGVAV